MKQFSIISVLLPVLVLVNVVHGAPSLDQEWKLFKEKFSKSYSDASEDQLRFEIWLRNKLYIEEHNRKVSSSSESRGRFYLAQNHLSDWTDEEYKRLRGFRSTRKPAPSNEDYPVSPDDYVLPNLPNLIPYMNTIPVSQLPPTVNWTAQGYVNPVENQGQCGDCWAFSASGAMEGLYYNATRTSAILSEQNLLDCSSTSTYGNSGCNGGAMVYAFQYVIDNKGIDTFSSYPYTGIQSTTCKYSSSNSVGYITGYRLVQQYNESALQQAVALIGPISVGINADSLSFQSYKSGIYQPPVCSPYNLDHAVLAVGYGTDNDQPYWLLKNSWGTNWGMQGYMMLARNDNNLCGIASDASFPTGFVKSASSNTQGESASGGGQEGAQVVTLLTTGIALVVVLITTV